MFLRHTLVLLVILSASLSPRPAEATDSFDNCTGFIDALPAIITTQGTWCLRSNLSTAIASGSAITIGTNNVTLDCNDYKVDGLAAGTSTSAFGVNSSERLNTTVRNCSIRGFYIGALIAGATKSSGHVVEDSRFDDNRITGVFVTGDASVVRRNLIVGTGGSPLGGFASGVDARLGVDVLDNSIVNVTSNTKDPAATADGIYTESNSNGRIRGNRIANVSSVNGGAVNGILTSLSSVWITRNLVIGTPSGTSTGITCSDNTGQASDNLVQGFTTPINVCTDAGGNIAP